MAIVVYAARREYFYGWNAYYLEGDWRLLASL